MLRYCLFLALLVARLFVVFLGRFFGTLMLIGAPIIYLIEGVSAMLIVGVATACGLLALRPDLDTAFY